ncbi:SHOCT domain-containing protein [Kitasatospora sp. NPDC004240]
MYWHDHDVNGWGIGLMTVTMLLLLALLILGVIALVRYLGHTTPHHRPYPPVPPHAPAPPVVPPAAAPPAATDRPAPEQLLAERLALGEIDPDEYRRRLSALRGDPPIPG